MAADTSLIFNILAKDKASRVFGTVGGAAGKLSAGIVAAGIAAGVGLAKVGGDFDAAFDSIRIGTGATGDQLAGLEDSFKRVATTVPNAIGDTATVLADFNTLTGATGKDLESLTETYLNLERITGESVGPETITRVFGDWGVATKDQASTMDELFRVSQTTGIGIGDLSTKVVQFGAPLRNMGFELDEAVALFGKWQKEGVNTETVMSGLRTASGKWAREGKDLPTMLQKTIEKIQGAGSAAKAQEIALENFGARAGPDMAAAILEGRFEIDELMATLSGNEDTINGLATETEDWQEKLAKLKNEGLVAIEPIASTVFGLLGDGVPILRNVGVWMQNNTGTVKALAIALGSIAATILLVNAGLKVYHGIQMVIRAVTIAWTAVQWLLNVAMMANPIGLIILLIVGLVAIIVLIATKTTWFQTIWKVVWGGIKKAAMFVWNWIKGTLWPGIQRVWQSIVRGAQMVWAGIRRYFGFWQGLLQRVLGWISGFWNGATSRLGRIVSFVRGLPRRIIRGLGNVGRMLYNAGRNIIQGLIDGIASMIQRVKDTIRGVAETVRNFLPFSPAKVGPLSGSGSPFRSGQAIVNLLAEGMASRSPEVSTASTVMAGAARPGLQVASGAAVQQRPGGTQRLVVEAGRGSGTVERAAATLVLNLLRSGHLRLRDSTGGRVMGA